MYKEGIEVQQKVLNSRYHSHSLGLDGSQSREIELMYPLANKKNTTSIVNEHLHN